MKKLNHSFSALIAVLFFACVVSCSGDDYSSPLRGQTISDQTFESGSNTKTISLGTADLTNCTITSSAIWCNAQIQNTSILVSVQPNETYEERQATITLTDPEDATTLSFVVVQEQNDAILVDGQTFAVSEDGGNIAIKVQSNVNYTVEIPSEATWLTKVSSSTRGLSNSTIILNASKNNSGDEREAVVKLNNPSAGVYSQFTVKQELTPNVTFDKAEFSIDELGGEIEVNVSSNIPIDINYSDTWVSGGNRTDKEDFSFTQKIIIAALPSGESSRSTKVIFKDKAGKWNILKAIEISQVSSLTIKDTDISLLIGKSQTLDVVNNTGKTLSWKSSNTSVATVNSSGKVTGVSKGNTTITVTTADGLHSAQCTVSVKDITDFISATAGGGSIMMVNNLIQYGSKLGWYFKNNSTESVKLKSLQLVDGVNGYEGNVMSVDETVAAGSSVGYTTTIGLLGIHTPVTCRFRYEYNGREYMATAVYSSIW